jgi:hypothetical protein
MESDRPPSSYVCAFGAVGPIPDPRLLGGRLHTVKRFACTTAIVVWTGYVGYERWYCFERPEDAQAALGPRTGMNILPDPG